MSWNAHTSHFFFFNDTATTEIYTLSLHDALPIFLVLVQSTIKGASHVLRLCQGFSARGRWVQAALRSAPARSEEHTSELQSRLHLVCRLLLEKKKRRPNERRAHLTGTALMQ